MRSFSKTHNKRIMSGTKKLGLVRTSPIIAKHFVPHMRTLLIKYSNVFLSKNEFIQQSASDPYTPQIY
tara:strand:+ start:453 stop:656 length:204 start_codon:yes stop_codon:yes gene_type:complete